MDRFQAMETFIRVVDAGSFKKAAETLHVLPSTVTRSIKELESHLGARLLNRTTRALSITDVGLRYYDSCKAILRDVHAAESVTAQQKEELQGTIRIGATPSLVKNFLIPALPDFCERHPGIRLDFHLGDATVDIVQQGIDCVIRTGEPPLSRLVARHLGAFHWTICASPRYLEQHGYPTTLDSLKDHVAVGYTHSRAGRSVSWGFHDEAHTVAIPLAGQISVNDTDAYLAAGVAGLGLLRIASYMVRQQLSDGHLVRLLPDLEAPLEPIFILYPQSRHLSPVIRAFIDWCTALIAQEAMKW
ncbi:LysR family transcriptional regulator [Pectobacterium parmentieri]|uniref:LysR family transcriptional regulator n=1 Tax=Pectobacterium parmentieri TaxID=1905730 RepID=A0A8B3FEF0_PECPM|nr:LysR family transcriptional regulator [Pectobacterium parmentieri]AOR61622.1 LysR family transcriptional regulator [Pectobacterium parmentieri]AYH11724.1 LysR family transcriptional regulator [Pectobacterium parmentieri]AYH17555.1 LysR family transcriptional regulator [Pectobacterium parmentieri]AYH38005.1 LysR family transcriptional regulator [Pectobacterium parmentieri]AZS58232.1 LysR family transcriptional regulator [Pectobacterium parmentieri]